MKEWFLEAFFDAGVRRHINLDKPTRFGPYGRKLDLFLEGPDRLSTNKYGDGADEIESALGQPLKKTKKGLLRKTEILYYMRWQIGYVRASTAPDAVITYARSVSPDKSQSSAYSGDSSKQETTEFSMLKDAEVFGLSAKNTSQTKVLPAKDFDFDAI